jgi:predicted nuclease of restriction endonuclease-like RecB superfamily
VTKYGLQLALVLPQLMECDRLSLEAEIRWGKARRPLAFRFEHENELAIEGEVPLPDEVCKLRDALVQKNPRYRVEVASEILDQPGVGLCVPDLKLTDPKSGGAVFVEVLGYWSREAVWRRVELAEQGLTERVIFAVSSRLRVSEEVLDGHESACLYVYKGVMSPTQILKRVDELLAKQP